MKPNQVVVIGDSLYNDIYGAHRNKMMGVQVKEVKEDDEIEK